MHTAAINGFAFIKANFKLTSFFKPAMCTWLKSFIQLSSYNKTFILFYFAGLEWKFILKYPEVGNSARPKLCLSPGHRCQVSGWLPKSLSYG
jgi:hypothetical protein